MEANDDRLSGAGWLLEPYDIRLAVTICLALIVATIAAAVGLMRFPAFPAVQLGAEPGNAQVFLTWTDRGDFDSWQYRQGVATRDFDEWRSVPDRCLSSSCVVRDLTNGREYYFQVRGTGKDVTGPPSNVAMAAPTDLPDRTKAIEDTVDSINALVVKIAAAIGRANDLCASETENVGTIYFAHDSDALTSSDDGTLQCSSYRDSLPSVLSELSAKCQENPHGLVILAGNASAPGPPSYNLDLSERRTRAVERKLKGIDCDIISVARGENHDQAVLVRDEHCDRNVRVSWCTASTPAEHQSNTARGSVALADR